MTPDQIIAAMPLVPYKPGGNDLTGMDCWGLVEFWYENVHMIKVRDRASHTSTPEGFAEGFSEAREWVSLERPLNGSVAAMKAVHGRSVLPAGHCGVYWQGRLLQMTEAGFVAPPVTDAMLRGKITGWFKHKSL